MQIIYNPTINHSFQTYLLVPGTMEPTKQADKASVLRELWGAFRDDNILINSLQNTIKYTIKVINTLFGEEYTKLYTSLSESQIQNLFF